MSANLSTFNGKAEMFVGSGKPAWHGEGVLIQGRATAEEALEYAHLNWDVQKVPNFINNIQFDKTLPITPENPKGFKVPDSYTVVRGDKIGAPSVLGTVGRLYEPIQNTEAFSFFDAIIDKGEAIYESAGALGNGERVWVLAKLPDDIIIGGNDPVSEYLLLVNSHDGTMSFTARQTNVRVVCQNTLSVALGSSTADIRIKHTTEAKTRLEEAFRVMGMARRQSQLTSEAFNNMASIQCNSQMFKQFMGMVFPADIDKEVSSKMKKIMGTVESLYEGQAIGSELAGKTLWGAYNAVSEFTSHIKTYRTNKLDALWFGSGYSLTQKAFSSAMKLANS